MKKEAVTARKNDRPDHVIADVRSQSLNLKTRDIYGAAGRAGQNPVREASFNYHDTTK